MNGKSFGESVVGIAAFHHIHVLMFAECLMEPAVFPECFTPFYPGQVRSGPAAQWDLGLVRK